MLFSLLLLPLTISVLVGQGTTVPLEHRTYDILDRIETKTGVRPNFHSGVRPYRRQDVVEYAYQLDTSQLALTEADRADIRFLYLENLEWLERINQSNKLIGQTKKSKLVPVAPDSPFRTYEEVDADTQVSAAPTLAAFRNERPFLKYFYDTPGNFFAVDEPGFQFRLDPLLDFKLAPALGDEEGVFFRNLRGAAIRGGVDDRIYFFTTLEVVETQLPGYVNERINRDKALPGAGLYKNYSSRVFNIDNGYGYLNSQAYLGFNFTEHVGLEFGHGRNFIGNGYRSLLLSDFGANYLYLKLNWRIWKFHYQNLYTDLSALSERADVLDRELPSKFMTAHYLDFRVNKKWTIGLYEAVIFSRQNQFELHYLNPVIFYRSVEQFIGSPDNVLIGLNTKWNVYPGLQVYGQVIMDEFKFDKLFFPADGEEGWWANKYGIQAGVKVAEPFGVANLFLQAEVNNGRPYLYAHRDTTGNSYSHYNQPLAHPLGANFREVIVRGRYRISPRLWADVRYLNMQFGADDGNLNYGGNILLPTRDRLQDFGNEIGQGITTDVNLIGFDLTYQLYHDIYADLHFVQRSEKVTGGINRTTRYIGLGARMNISNHRSDF